ncbi:MAG: hypothetical protein CMM95_01950 [Rickettsiales bacterium]|nr:hypothetical protein [Rickettsiales bacterium]
MYIFERKNLNIFIFLSFLLLLTPTIAVSGDNTSSVNDPFEQTNRSIFNFNNSLDENFFKPVAKAWRKVPDIPRKPISNLATTAKAPISLANAVLQLNRESIGNILAKFLINMTFGLGGMVDMAGKEEFGGIPTVEEDFGQTLAVWGVPEGPYVMLPVFGPSSVRDSIGLGVDTVTNPLTFAYRMSNIGLEARLTGPVVRGVTTREKYLDYVDELKAGSLDFYATMRSLYRQRRQKEISGNLEDDKMSLNNIPVDIYDEPDLASEIETIVQEELSSDTVVKNAEKTTGRVYNGIMPSSLYPDFSESRVNLIN